MIWIGVALMAVGAAAFLWSELLERAREHRPRGYRGRP
jgi:hypothetical protein